MRLSNIAKNILLLFSCALASIHGLSQIICIDIWLHLKTGAWIWENRAVPHTQLYSFLLGPKEWIDHEWLFQAIVYPIFSWAGINGLIIFRFFLVCIILGIFFVLAKNTRRLFLFSCLTIILSTVTASSRFIIRPELFSLLFVVFFIYMLKSYKGGNWIFLLLPLQILWVNIHGYYIIGPMLVGGFVLAKFIEVRARLPFSWNENGLYGSSLQRPLYLFPLLLAAAVINPYLLKGAAYPFKILGSIVSGSLDGSYPFTFVAELKSVPILHIIYDEKLIMLSTIIIIFFFSVLVNIRRIDIFDLIVFFGFLALTTKAKRHISIFAVSSALLILFNFNSAEYHTASFMKERRGMLKLLYHKAVFFTIGALLSVHLLFIIKNSFVMATSRYIYNLKGEAKGFLFGIDKANLNYSFGAVRFIKENNIRGNVFNFFNNGAYLIFGLYPDCRVFIDGRTELYGAALLKAGEVIFSRPSILDRVKDNLKIDCVVLPCYIHRMNISMFKYLYKSKDWKLVFFDGQSCVFLRDLPPFKDLIKNKQVVLEDLRIEPDSRLVEIARRKRYLPHPYITASHFLYDIGIPGKALDIIDVAKEISPQHYEVINLRAVILDGLGRDREALDEFMKAAEIEPDNSSAYRNIGVFYIRRGYPETAKEYFMKGLRVNPGDKELSHYLKEADRYIKQGSDAPSMHPSKAYSIAE